MNDPLPIPANAHAPPSEPSSLAAAWLQRAPALLPQLLETVPVGLIVVAPEETIVQANREAQRTLGLRWDESTGCYVPAGAIEIVREDGVPCPAEEMPTRRCLRSGRAQPAVTLGVRRADGAVTWAVVTAMPLCDPVGGQADGAVVTFRAIAERTPPEEAARETYEMLRSLVHASPLAIVALDKNDRVTLWNPAAERTFGWKAAEVLAQPLPFVPADKQQEYRSFRAAELRGESRSGSEVRRLHKDGHAVDVSVWTAPVRDSHDAVRSTIAVLADITESRRAQELLHENAERLRVLSQRLLEVQELERRHLARELHDEIGQILTGLQFTLETSFRLEGEQLRTSLAEGQRLVKDLTARIRDLSLRLRPTMLDDLGLLPALLWHLERYSAQTQIHVIFEHRGLERRLHPPEVETAAYRIIQEALTNVARHADVREARVRLWRDRNQLVLRVEDQGRGFNTPAVMNGDRSSGLSGMHERAALLGGHLTVASMPGAGTLVSAELPFQGLQERRRRGFNSSLG